MLHLYDLILMYTTHIKIINLIFQIYVVLDSITHACENGQMEVVMKGK